LQVKAAALRMLHCPSAWGRRLLALRLGLVPENLALRVTPMAMAMAWVSGGGGCGY
jgi:hypothetical protein